MATEPKAKNIGGDSRIKAGLIWMNGQMVPQEEAKVSVLTHALHYGTSVFEGIRAYDTPKARPSSASLSTSSACSTRPRC